MSYSIVFKTRFLTLKDGRVLHLSRQGCNNDTAGRDKNDWFYTIFDNVDKLNNYIDSFKDCDEDFLQIGSRKHLKYSDYYKHLKRMYKNENYTFNELLEKYSNFRTSCIEVNDHLTFIYPNDGPNKEIDPDLYEEFSFYDYTQQELIDKMCDVKFNKSKYTGFIIPPSDYILEEDDLLNALNRKNPGIEFRLNI